MKIRIYKALFLLGAFAISLSAFLVYKHFDKKTNVGEYLYSKVLSHMDKLDKITVKVGDVKYNLDLEDDLWRLEHMNNYYANHFVMNNFFTDLYNSQIFSKVDKFETSMFENPVKVVFYDKEGNLIEKVLIGKSSNEDIYRFVKIGDDVYVASGVFNFPKELISWIQQPSFSITKDNISSVFVGKNGEMKKTSFKKLPSMAREYLSFTYFEAAVPEKMFDKEKFAPENLLVAETKDGLKVSYDVYSNAEEYWVKLTVATNKLPTAQVAEYVQENAFLYEGWVFKIPSDYAKYMFEF